MQQKDLKDGMYVIDTDDGMVMKYEKSGKSDFFKTDNASWHVCQFDLSRFEPYNNVEEK